MRRALLLVFLAACHHDGTQARRPMPPARTLAIVEDGVGVVLRDGTTVPRSHFLATTNTRQVGPYLFYDGSAVDLRDPSAPILGLDLSEDAKLGEGAYGEVIATAVDGGLDVAIDGVHHVVPWPTGGYDGFALSPDGATAAVAAGKLYTLDTRAGAFVALGGAADNLDVDFLDEHTLIVSRDASGVDYTLRSLTGAPDRDLALADGWTADNLEDLAITAPRVPVLREETHERGLYDVATGSVLAYPWGDHVLAVAADGSAAAITTPCQVTGGLTLLTAAGAKVVRPSPAETCNVPQEESAPPISAVFDADGALVTAMPDGDGWQVTDGDLVVRQSANPMRVFEYTR